MDIEQNYHQFQWYLSNKRVCSISSVLRVGYAHELTFLSLRDDSSFLRRPMKTQKKMCTFGVIHEWVWILISPHAGCLNLGRTFSNPRLCVAIYKMYKTMVLRIMKYIKCLAQWLAHNRHLKMIISALALLPDILDLLITEKHFWGPFSTWCSSWAEPLFCLCVGSCIFCHCWTLIV